VSDRPRSVLLRLIKGLVLLVLLLAFGVGGAAAWFWHEFNAAGPLAEDKVVVIPKGVGRQGIAHVLADAGVIRDPFVFALGARLTADGEVLHAGEFKFPAGVSGSGAMDVLIVGKPVLHRVTVAEGLTVAEIFDILTQTPELKGDLPSPPPEGSLLPETYFFTLGDTRAEIVGRMENDMKSALANLWAGRDTEISLTTPAQAVTMASLVEKETGVVAERPKVAAVFYNRMKKGMALQSDPTVIFALTQGKGKLDRPLTSADLKIDSPYNTYLITGLPEGPIANPGVAAINAVLHPAKTKDLYFVADGSGGHAFAETLEQHNKNVAKWRKFLKDQAATAKDPQDLQHTEEGK
jgi:UPF0755 protein